MFDGDGTKKAVLFWMLLWEHCSYTFQSCSSVSLWHSHLHSMSQSVFAFALRTTRASQLLSHFSQGVESSFFFPDLYDYRASCYINHREKQFLLQRKAILLFLFICHYIWTFLHYVHVAFTQDRKKKIPKHKWNYFKKRHLFDFGLRAWHKESNATLALRNALSKRLRCLDVNIAFITMRRKQQQHGNPHTVVTHCTIPGCQRSPIKNTPRNTKHVHHYQQ